MKPKFTITKQQFRTRFAWWPVKLWKTELRGISETGRRIWLRPVREVLTFHEKWYAFDDYQQEK